MRRRLITSSQQDGAKIYWITDTHILAAADGDPHHPDAIKVDGRRWIYTARQKLRDFVDQANKAADSHPVAVVHTGDMVERYDEESMSMFLSEWERLDPEIPKFVTPGNHDFANGSYHILIERLGRAGSNEIAGSKFNQSFALRLGDVTVRIIMLDTNIGPDGHGSYVTGYIQPNLAAWLQSELANAPENLCMVFMHHGPSGPVSYFDDDSLIRLNNALTAAVAWQDNWRTKQYFVFWGHDHRTSWHRSHRLISRVTGVGSAAAVEYNPSRFTILTVTPDGHVRIDDGIVRYPYAS